MLLNILCARFHSYDILAKLPHRKLALVQCPWRRFHLLGAGLAHHGAPLRSNGVHFLLSENTGLERYDGGNRYCARRPPSSSLFSCVGPPLRNSSLTCTRFNPYTGGRNRCQRALASSLFPRWDKQPRYINRSQWRERYKRFRRILERSVQKIKPLTQQDGRLNSSRAYSRVSHRRRKRTRTPPSRLLDHVLKGIQQESARPPKWSNKVDYSFRSPLSSVGTRRAIYYRPTIFNVPRELSLQWVLVSYATAVETSLNGDEKLEALSRVFNGGIVDYLNSKGYEETDVALWHWILSATSSTRAALRLNLAWALVAQKTISEKPPIPVFVFLQLLRRKHFGLRALFHLISHAWQRLGGITPTFASQLPKERFAAIVARPGKREQQGAGAEPLALQVNSNGNIYNMTEPSIMVMVVRLARHARQVWPASLSSIATLFTRYINSQVHTSNTVDKTVASRLSKLYNKALSLVALPSSQNPYAQVSHHQHAQFIILRAMDIHEPPLVVNREGYRSVTRVQLAHRKTLSEQNWADLKVDSWPPWKEDKLGFDAEKGVESGLSRASHAIRKMHEAGYSMQLWEQTIQIYAGWDTDSSPTIQTRKFMPGTFSSSKEPLHADPSAQPERDDAIQDSGWAARVRATRTLDEAWACFLNYNKVRRKRDQQVYLAMCEKIVFNFKRCEEEQRQVSKTIHPSVYPGDGLEVLRKPTYANSAIYVPTPPPTIDTFLALMKDHGVQPTQRLLAFLLSHAQSFEFGRKAYAYSFKPSPLIISFLYRRGNDAVLEVANDVNQWPGYLQTAFLRFIGKFMTPRRSQRYWTRATYSAHGEYLFHNDRDLGLMILLEIKPRYLPAWYTVISTLASGSRTDHRGVDEARLLDSLRVLKIVDSMQEIELEPDIQGVQLLCVALESNLWAQSDFLAQSHEEVNHARFHDETGSEELRIARIKTDSRKANQDLLAYVKAAFQRCISMKDPKAIFQNSPVTAPFPMLDKCRAVDPQTQLPRISDIPPAATLHALVRVLGLSRDYEAILQLARWMTQHGSELQLASLGRSRSHTMLKRVVTAIRVFLDRAWEDEVGKLETYDPSMDEPSHFQRSPPEPGLYDMSYTTGELDDGKHLSTGKDAAVKIEGRAEELIQQAMNLMDAIDYEWGGWPTDDEVDDYLRKGRHF